MAHHEYLGFGWDSKAVDNTAYVIGSSVVSPCPGREGGTSLVSASCYKNHGNRQGIVQIPSGYHQCDAETTRWAGNVVFKYAQIKVAVYLRISSFFFLVFHSALRSYSKEETRLGVFHFSIFNKSMLSWDVMCVMCKDIAHCDCVSALVSSCKITYASAVLIRLPW